MSRFTGRSHISQPNESVVASRTVVGLCEELTQTDNARTCTSGDRCLLALPARCALTEEGRNALLGVLAEEGGRECGLFGLDAFIEVTGV